MTDEFETAERVSRDEAAGVLQRLAAGVGAGSVTLGADGLSVDVPDEVELELEVEREDGERSLEAELTWPDATAADVASVDEESANHENADAEDAAGGSSDGTNQAETSVSERSADEGQVAPVEDAIDDADSPEGAAETVGEAVAVSVPDGSKASFELYRDRADEWRWRLRHRNGNIIADSGEGYDRKRGAMQGLESVRANAPLADVAEESSE